MAATGSSTTCTPILFDDEWQRRRSPFWELDKVDIPVLSIGAWGKAALHLRGNFMGYERVSGPKQLLVTGAASFAETQRLFADADFHREELLPWYDRHLKGVDNAVMDRRSGGNASTMSLSSANGICATCSFRTWHITTRREPTFP